jgi:hypothetical protein
MEKFDHLKNLTRYNIFIHGTGVRVIEIGPYSIGRHGLVVSIKETAPDWVEPQVLFDNTDAPISCRAILALEP